MAVWHIIYIGVLYAIAGSATAALVLITLKPPEGFEARIVIALTSLILWPVVLLAYVAKLLTVAGMVCLWVFKEAKFG